MAEETSFQTVLDSLQDSKKEFPKSYLQYFSDIAPLELKTLLDVWPRVKPTRKLALLDALLSLLDSDTLVSFDDLGRALLNDSDGEIRARAIRLLAEADDPKLVDAFVEILKNDVDLAPRLEAAALLGEFVLLGELEELDATLHHAAEDALISVAGSDEHASLRRAAIESLGFSSRPEVETLIQSAFNRADAAWKNSALIAMGRSNDEQWSEQVISMLLNDDPRIRLAAVRAAGELSIEGAGSILISMLLDGEEDDDEVIAAGIWSLSQIGGDDARAFLVDMLDKTEDEDITTYIEEALENLDFTEEMGKFELLELDEDELDEDNLVEVDDEDEEDA